MHSPSTLSAHTSSEGKDGKVYDSNQQRRTLDWLSVNVPRVLRDWLTLTLADEGHRAANCCTCVLETNRQARGRCNHGNNNNNNNMTFL